jgi:hypothetical protein
VRKKKKKEAKDKNIRLQNKEKICKQNYMEVRRGIKKDKKLKTLNQEQIFK